MRLSHTLTRYDWLIILLLLPFLLLPNGRLSLLLLLIPALWLTRRLSTGRFLPATPYNLALLLLLATVLISLLVTVDVHHSFPKVAGLLLGIALFYSAVAYSRGHPAGLWRLLAFFLLAGLAITIVSLIGAVWTGPFAPLNTIRTYIPGYSHIPGAVGGAINPNETAGILAWIVPLITALVCGGWRPLWRRHKALPLLLTALGLFTTAVLIATLSRSSLLGVAASLLLMLAIRYRRGRWLLFAAVLIALALAYHFNLAAPILDSNPAAGGVEINLNARLEIWSRGLYGLADFPFTGMGMNNFRHLVHVLYPLFLISPDIDIAHAHNHLLQAGLDLGIPGMIAYLSLWLISAALLWRAWRATTGPLRQTLIIGLSGALTAGWIFGLFDAVALGARPGFIWWLLLALITTTNNQ